MKGIWLKFLKSWHWFFELLYSGSSTSQRAATSRPRSATRSRPTSARPAASASTTATSVRTRKSRPRRRARNPHVPQPRGRGLRRWWGRPRRLGPVSSRSGRRPRRARPTTSIRLSTLRGRGSGGRESNVMTTSKTAKAEILCAGKGHMIGPQDSVIWLRQNKNTRQSEGGEGVLYTTFVSYFCIPTIVRRKIMYNADGGGWYLVFLLPAKKNYIQTINSVWFGLSIPSFFLDAILWMWYNSILLIYVWLLLETMLTMLQGVH